MLNFKLSRSIQSTCSQ